MSDVATSENGPWPTFSDLILAYGRCRLRKKPSIHQLRFESRLGENILQLHHEIHRRKYQPSRSVCFIVSHPKPREIFAAHFRDRIVHHLLVQRLEWHWERKFIHASFACRKNKGPYKAHDYLNKRAAELSAGGRREVFALQLDVSSFYVTIWRPILLRLILAEIPPREKLFRELVSITFSHDARTDIYFRKSKASPDLIPAHKSWFNQAKDRGLPIGNLTSQFASNVYLNALDHLITRQLRPGAYLRYMDDLTLLDTDANRLRAMVEPVGRWLEENRGQSLNAGKTTLTTLRDGIDYLGYFQRQNPDLGGIIEKFAPAKKKWEFIREIRRLEKTGVALTPPSHPLAFPSMGNDLRSQLSSVNSRLGLFRHARGYLLRKEGLERAARLLANPGRLPKEIHDAWEPVCIRRPFRSLRVR